MASAATFTIPASPSTSSDPTTTRLSRLGIMAMWSPLT